MGRAEALIALRQALSVDPELELLEEQEVLLSNVLDALIFCAARSRSAELSMTTGTLPAPTPIAGVPLL